MVAIINNMIWFALLFSKHDSFIHFIKYFLNTYCLLVVGARNTNEKVFLVPAPTGLITWTPNVALSFVAANTKEKHNHLHQGLQTGGL